MPTYTLAYALCILMDFYAFGDVALKEYARCQITLVEQTLTECLRKGSSALRHIRKYTHTNIRAHMPDGGLVSLCLEDDFHVCQLVLFAA